MYIMLTVYLTSDWFWQVLETQGHQYKVSHSDLTCQEIQVLLESNFKYI